MSLRCAVVLYRTNYASARRFSCRWARGLKSNLLRLRFGLIQQVEPFFESSRYVDHDQIKRAYGIGGKLVAR